MKRLCLIHTNVEHQSRLAYRDGTVHLALKQTTREMKMGLDAKGNPISYPTGFTHVRVTVGKDGKNYRETRAEKIGRRTRRYLSAQRQALALAKAA